MFAKIFTQIYDSSIANDWQVRVVFEDLLILATPEGVVDMTPEAISARTRIPLDIVSRALSELQKSDPKSRTPEHEGRRLILLNSHRDWGWIIVNYSLYRGMRCEFDRRSYMRKYMREKRKAISKTESLTEVNKNLTPPSSYTSSVPISNTSDLPLKNLPANGSQSKGLQDVEFFKTKVGALFKKTKGCWWDHLEETWMVQVMRRPEWKAELETICAKWKDIEYPPQSTARMLEMWASTLDKARIAKHKTCL